MKGKFAATFADGTTITRTSNHSYTAAWRATWMDDGGHRVAVTGFAASRENASPMKPRASFIWRGMSPKARARAIRENAEFLTRSDYQVEFAEAVLVNSVLNKNSLARANGRGSAGECPARTCAKTPAVGELVCPATGHSASATRQDVGGGIRA